MFSGFVRQSTEYISLLTDTLWLTNKKSNKEIAPHYQYKMAAQKTPKGGQVA